MSRVRNISYSREASAAEEKYKKERILRYANPAAEIASYKYEEAPAAEDGFTDYLLTEQKNKGVRYL